MEDLSNRGFALKVCVLLFVLLIAASSLIFITLRKYDRDVANSR